MNTIVKKRFDLLVTDPERTYSKIYELDKHIIALHGLLVTSDKDDLLYYRGSQRIELNKTEIFPEGYESKLLMSGINLAPNLRYYETGALQVGNGLVKLEFQDRADIRAAFLPYRVSLYLSCEQTE